MRLSDLVDLGRLQSTVDEGLVTDRRHGGLRILNYTNKATYSEAWDEVTTLCRGLVVDDRDEVVARPFPKFFGVQEPHAPAIPDGCAMHVTEKLDGSLGIAYLHDGQTWITTRGRLDSPQGREGTEIWRERYASVRFGPDVTPLFEVIYPENRVLVDYGTTRDLVLLAVIDIATGADLPLGAIDWPGPVAAVRRFGSVDEIVACAETDSDDAVTEGFVARFDTGGDGPHLRVKVKSGRYVDLHRLKYGLNARRVWAVAAVEAMSAHSGDHRAIASRLKLNPDEVLSRLHGARGPSTDGYRQDLPEELWPWFDETVAAIRARVADITGRYQAIVETAAAEAAASDHPDRAFADAARRLAAEQNLHPGPCFGLRRGTWAAHAEIWRAATPDPDAPQTL